MPIQVSIITINLNNAVGLKKTLKSITEQTFRNFEHIIIDGGSSDGSLEIIKEYATNSTHWVSEPDGGIYPAINKGIQMAQGAYCFILPSGDWFHSPEVLSGLFNEETSNYDLIYGNIEKIEKDGSRVTERMPDTLSMPFMLQQQLYRAVVLIKKDIFKKYGLFDESFSLAADWLFFLKTVILGQASYIHKDITVAVYTLDGVTSKIGKQKFIALEKEEIVKRLFSKAILDFYEEGILNKRLTERAGLKKIMRIWRMKYPAQKKIKQLRYSLSAPFSRLGTLLSMARLKKKVDYKNIPIIINNYNRLSYLLELIGSLEKRGYKNIFIIDNMSSFPPLLEYYKTTPYKVYHLKENIGLSALWDTEVFNDFKDQYYVYTDSDLKIADHCPDDFMLLFYVLLRKYPAMEKVGFSIKIDDLPDLYQYKEKVISWERSLNTYKIEHAGYIAPIDTTFALYRPMNVVKKLMFEAIRVSAPYEVHHLPWYEDFNNLNNEQRFYYDTLNRKASTHWSLMAVANKENKN